MIGDFNQDYFVQAGADVWMDAAGSEEETSANTNNQYNGRITASMTGVSSFHPYQASAPPGGYPQSVYPNQIPPPTQMQQEGHRHSVAHVYDGPTIFPNSYGYTGPGQLMAQGPWYGQGPGPNMGNQQYFQMQAEDQLDLQAYSNTQLAGQYSATSTLDHGHGAPAYGMYDQPYSVPAGQYVDPQDTVAVTMSHSTMPGSHARGPGSAFVPAGFYRHPDHQDQLRDYTDELVDRVQMNLEAPVATASEPDDLSMADKQIAFASLDKIQAQSSQKMGPVDVNPITYDTVPEYVMSEGSLVVVDADASDVQSWITSEGPRRPDTNSRVSIALPTTEADARSDVVYCQECGAKYTGRYGKGNLGRHRRHKHDREIVELPCEDSYCSKVFQRQDARLKHYRHDHPNLNPAPAMSRTTSSSYSGYLGSPYVYALSDFNNGG